MVKTFNKKGISEVVAAFLMIVIVLALIGIVWGVVNNLVSKEISKTEKCYGNFDKVVLNGAYTCYNRTSGEFYFSISVGETTVDEILVSIGSNGISNTIMLNTTSRNIATLKNYPSRLAGVSIPGENSGKTYIYSGLSNSPDYIRIAPVMGGENCQESDALNAIEDCSD